MRSGVWGALAAVTFLIACDRPPRPEAYALFVSKDDLLLLADALNRQIQEGRLLTLNSGRNLYSISLPGSGKRYTVPLTVEPRTVIVPLGAAEVWVNALRFREASVRWNPRERALQIELEVEDKADGILGTLRILQERRQLKFVVESARLTLYLEPRVGERGTLDFAPVRGLFTANTDDALPEIRPIVREQLNELSRAMTTEMQTTFDRYRNDLTAWFATQLAKDAALTHVTIAVEGATFLARSRADVNQDGIVDIADLVSVARDFGASGPSGFAPTDVNGDGRVDIEDLVRVVLRFGVRGTPSIRPGQKR